MILQALYQLADRDHLIEDPDFMVQPIRWLITVGDGGKLHGISDTSTSVAATETPGKRRKSKPAPKPFRVPRDAGKLAATANDYAGPLFDKPDYVFGVSLDPKRQAAKHIAKAKDRQGLFIEKTRRAYAESEDEGVAAVLAFLESVATGNGPKPPEESEPGDLFAFIYAPDVDTLLTDRPAVRAWWKAERQKDSGDAEATLQCLVTGDMISESGLFPKVKRVPGVQGDISLVSFNASAFLSYGLEDNENAPVSREAAEAIGTALNRLLNTAYPDPSNSDQHLPPRSFRISSDTAFCYWAAGDDGGFSDFLDALFRDPDPATVKEAVWQSLWRGVAPSGGADLTPFYGLVITGQTGRAILRDWFETTLSKAEANVARHFDDIRIVRNAPWKKDEEAPPAIGLRTLLESIAVNGDQANIPAGLAGQFLRAAFTGTLYPTALLTRAVERARIEMGRTEWTDLQRRDARAALIKAVLNRRSRLQPSTPTREITEDMDPENKNPGYVLGCLMAVLERLQQEALGDVNASVVDKSFSGASAAPRATFDRLLKNARHHVKKARDGDGGGKVYHLERLIDELLTNINVDHKVSQKTHAPIGFPLTLPIEQQGLFVIGYHHMRHFLWMSKERRAEWEGEHPDAPAAYLWMTRKAASEPASAA